jgi:hypothetical protein
LRVWIQAIYARKPIGIWVKDDLAELEAGGTDVLRCVQRAGTVAYVPSHWGHGVMNLQETVGFANEFDFDLPPPAGQAPRLESLGGVPFGSAMVVGR